MSSLKVDLSISLTLEYLVLKKLAAVLENIRWGQLHRVRCGRGVS